MSFVENYEHHKNIISCEGSILYAYRITPINSLFAEPQQLQELLSTMRATLRKVNMPGTIAILSEEQDPKEILKFYLDSYNKNGFPELKEWFNKVYRDTALQLSKKINYNYFIYIIFEDGKTSMRKKIHFLKEQKGDISLNKGNILVYSRLESDLFKKLRDTGNLDVYRVQETNEIDYLFNRFSFPSQSNDLNEEWDVLPTETHLKYNYLTANGAKRTSLVKNFILKENRNYEVSDNYGNTALNELQLQTTPTDVFIKFEYLHHQKFLKEVNTKREKMNRAYKKYQRLAQRRDKEYELVSALINVANDVDMKDDEFDFVYQMQFRIAVHEDNEEELLARYAYVKKILAIHKLEVDGGNGIQEKLLYNVFPHKQSYFKCIQIADPVAFTNFNFLGGFYIGHEKQGLIVGQEKHSDKPVLYQTADILKHHTKTQSPSILIAGTTGSGKSQLQNHEALLFMIVFGIHVLTIDPKNDRKGIQEGLGSEIVNCLVIGDKDSPQGMFDPYLVYEDEMNVALEKAQQLIISLERAVNPEKEINLLKVKEAHEKLMLKVKGKKITRATFTELVEILHVIDGSQVVNTKALSDNRIVRLFFGNEATNINEVFNFSKPYNVVTFADGEAMMEVEEDNFESRLFSILVRQVQSIVVKFQKQHVGKRKYLAIDELALYKKLPGASSALENIVKTVRSDLVDTRLLSQCMSDIPPQVLSQIETAFIGGQRSEIDVNIALKHFGLEDNYIVQPFFKDTTKMEGVQEDKKYTFICVDYNNRKCLLKLDFLDCLAPMLNTKLKED